MLIINTSNYKTLANKIAIASKSKVGNLESKKFPDGERYLRILDTVENEPVLVVGGTINDEETLELYDLVSTLAEMNPHSLSVFIPYFGYSTMERSVKYGEVITAKTRAQLLDSLPDSCKLYLVDLHAEKVILNFFKKHKPTHISSFSAVVDVIVKVGLDNLVVASPDAGRSKVVELLALELKIPAAYICKNRINGDSVELKSINADVLGKNVIIYDDMIRSGSTLVQAAKAYKEAGALKLYAVSTHCVFDEKTKNRMLATGLFEQIYVSDSHPKAVQFESDSLIKNFSIVSSALKVITGVLV